MQTQTRHCCTCCETILAKFGCSLGQCGSCTVMIGSAPVVSCTVPLMLVGDRPVTTVEGLGTSERPGPMQREVGDIEDALAFYGRLFEFSLCGKSEDAAFIDLGDQFIALQKGPRQPSDDGQHFGLVVDDKQVVRQALADAGVKPLPGRFLDFLDPWGYRIAVAGEQ